MNAEDQPSDETQANDDAEAPTKTMHPTRILSFVEELKLKDSKLIMTYRARDERGEDFFAYVFCDKEGVINMKRDYISQKSGAAKDYGEVLYADFIKDPNEKARLFLKNWLKENGGEMLSS